MTETPARPTTPPDTTRWPGLDAPATGPRTRVSAAVARKLFCGAVERLDVTVHLEGRTLGRGGPEMTIHHPEEFFARVGRHQLIGFGEAYLTGAWDAPDLGGFLTVLAAEISDLVPRPLQSMRSVIVKRPPRRQRSSKQNSRSNIAHHYDLSNDLFRLFLDETLSYSAALWDTSVSTVPDTLNGRPGSRLQAAPPGTVATDSLAEASGRKIERLLDAAGVTEGTSVLEIGTGWGELAIRAARRGATVHSITLSSEQLALAEERIAEAGYADRVTVALCDYRDLEAPVGPHGATGYDAVVSVEMIEAVGHEYWRTYFETIDKVLAPGGKVAIQAITMPHDRMLATRNTYTWIHKYIFPGGLLPSVEAVDEVTREHTSLRLVERFQFGSHYAETLRLWDEAFLARADEVVALGFDDVFLRMWHFYLEYSRAGFASGYIDDYQLLWERA
ncbi:class I SAM-dependent methyltransferase [Nocardioides marinus]|jgi:cyclopropane-fatty-acyl-phospholipid synthase|uniref:Cyclopropane-fatty-acyl-phospholipid synthase n=2 Tax=Nocardioides marinus TaxID=374514 RepID=A0A7Z0C673_9ACTN|nr:class I SAM-dependent methyltransferase [Nocardioides marinus]NYI11889.1 cyclopropane-fatty-acyl-phospholipid synthase [Nocardioides marinus]